jgi:predicted nuclease with TOPRIM domain
MEICYTHDTAYDKNCPACELQEQLDNANKEIERLETEKNRLDDKIIELENKIDNLKLKIINLEITKLTKNGLDQ